MQFLTWPCRHRETEIGWGFRRQPGKQTSSGCRWKCNCFYKPFNVSDIQNRGMNPPWFPHRNSDFDWAHSTAVVSFSNSAHSSHKITGKYIIKGRLQCWTPSLLTWLFLPCNVRAGIRAPKCKYSPAGTIYIRLLIQKGKKQRGIS